jgi:hypothetical protein
VIWHPMAHGFGSDSGHWLARPAHGCDHRKRHPPLPHKFQVGQWVRADASRRTILGLGPRTTTHSTWALSLSRYRTAESSFITGV